MILVASMAVSSEQQTTVLIHESLSISVAVYGKTSQVNIWLFHACYHSVAHSLIK